MKLLYPWFLLVLATPVCAHGPTPQKTDQTVLIQAPAETVWKLLSEPCAIRQWHPDVADCQSSDARKRELTLKNGAKLNEEFDEVLVEEMSISYRLAGNPDIKALPVSSLTGRIKLKPEGSGVRVSWMARYYRADTTNEPPKGMDDQSALNAVNQYVKSGLDGLASPAAKK